MIWVIFSILSFSLYLLLLKVGSSKRRNPFHIAIFSFFTSIIFGAIAISPTIDFTNIIDRPWISYSAIIGILLCGLLIVTSLSFQKSGAFATILVTGIAILVPVLLPLFKFNGSVHLYTILTTVLAFLGFVLFWRKSENTFASFSHYVYPITVFIGYAIFHVFLKKTLAKFVVSDQLLFVLMVLFFGMLSALLAIIASWKFKIRPKSVISGVLLSIPLFCSLYFLVSAFQYYHLNYFVTLMQAIGSTMLTIIGLFLFFSQEIYKRKKDIIAMVLCLLALALLIYKA